MTADPMTTTQAPEGGFTGAQLDAETNARWPHDVQMLERSAFRDGAYWAAEALSVPVNGEGLGREVRAWEWRHPDQTDGWTLFRGIHRNAHGADYRPLYADAPSGFVVDHENHEALREKVVVENLVRRAFDAGIGMSPDGGQTFEQLWPLFLELNPDILAALHSGGEPK